MERWIYFGAAIRGSREDLEIYQRMIAELKRYGTVLTEHIGNVATGATGDPNMTRQEIRQRDLDWLSKSTHFVAELTMPSLGVGYEARIAEERSLPFIGFQRNGIERVSAMLSGHYFDKRIVYYSKDDFGAVSAALQAFFGPNS